MKMDTSSAAFSFKARVDARVTHLARYRIRKWTVFNLGEGVRATLTL